MKDSQLFPVLSLVDPSISKANNERFSTVAPGTPATEKYIKGE